MFDRKFEWAARITGKDFTGWVNSTTCDDVEAVQCLLQRMHLLPIEVPQKRPHDTSHDGGHKEHRE